VNKVFQLVWNHFSRTWVAAGETAKRKTKGRYAVTGILAALAALGIGNPSAKPKSKNSQSFGLSCLTVALAMAQGGMVYAATPAQTALPTGAHIAAGQANIVQTDNTLTVQQQTDKLITNWQSFDIGSQATVNFHQPSSDSVALNRITNQDPTQILGNLNANGQIFLLNPAGIIIGNEAQVNVNTLVATTLNMTDQDFLDENYALTGDPNSASKIVNQGTITTPEGGRVALIAPVVENQGTITTPDGTTALAAASEVQLDLSGNGSLGIRIDKGTLNALVENEQLIQAQNGQVVLTARAVDALTKSVVNNDGIIEATSLTSKGGRIVLEGDDINLSSTSQIDASGETGGGEVLIGGEWQGTGDMYQAETVTMDAGASIKADAITKGDGGKVVLWSDITNTDSLTGVHGDITARGGVQGGDGGQIETSGAHLDTSGIQIDAGSTDGESGHWLIDPYNYTVDASAAANIASALNNSTSVTLTTSSDVTNYGSDGNSAGGGSVWINSAITATGGSADLTIEAASSVTISADITTYGDVYIKAGDAIDQNGATTVTTNGGNLVFWSNSNTSWDANGYIRTGSIVTDGGHVWLGGSGLYSGTATWHGMTVGTGYATSSTLDALALRANIDTRSSTNQATGGDI
jgi:filamentous hemagglutinin family protein